MKMTCRVVREKSVSFYCAVFMMSLVVMCCLVLSIGKSVKAYEATDAVTSSNNSTAGSAEPNHSSSETTVWAWGYNRYSQLGIGSVIIRKKPVMIGGLSNVVYVAGGNYHSLAVKSDGTVWAWGNNTSGQLGNNSTTNSGTPVQVSSLTGVVAIAGGYYHSLAIESGIASDGGGVTASHGRWNWKLLLKGSENQR